MDRDMRRGAIISGSLHVAFVLALILTFPVVNMTQTTDDSVSVDFQGPPAPKEAKTPGKVPASAEDKLLHKAPEAERKPLPKAIEQAPPPPPPPPPTFKAPPTKVPPAPAPPKQVTEQPSLVPLPKPPPPQPPQKTTSPHVVEKPTPPKPNPAPAQSTTSQPNVTKNPAPLSQTVLNTLLELKSLEKQTHPPKAKYNPDQDTAPSGGLTSADINAIGNHVRPCWTVDANAQGLSGLSVALQVTTDGTGTVHEAVVAPQDQAKMSDPIFNAFANRAIDAVMNVQCATLPLPSYMMGSNQTFLFNFSP
jgi:outer membrane biosynthesis protein TonB